jgi:hypothetical protein
MYGSKVIFNVIAPIQHFIQMNQSVQKLHPPQKLEHPPIWNDQHHLHTKFHPNPPVGSNVIRGFICTHFKSLNVHHFGMAEAMTMSPSVASLAYQTS